jgi:hypothetical protein
MSPVNIVGHINQPDFVNISEQFTAMNEFLVEQDMATGAGLTEIGVGIGSIGEAITACCNDYFTKPNLTTTTTAPDGTVATSSTVGVPALYASAIQGCCTSLGAAYTGAATITAGAATAINAANVAACQADNAAALMSYEAQQESWQMKWDDWFQSYEDYRDLTSALYFAQILADAVVLAEMLSIRKDALDKAFTALCTQEGIHQQLAGDFGEVSARHKAHMAEVETKNAEMMAGACGAMDTMTANAEMLMTLWSDETPAGIGWQKLQKDHIQNMATHLAQLCTDARDANLNLSTLLQSLDNTWLPGGGWQEYEDCMNDLTPGGFADVIKSVSNKSADLCEYMEMCGTTMAKCYYDADDPANSQYISVIKPVMDALVMQMGDAGGVLESAQELTDSAIQCANALKETYTAVYEGADNAISPEILNTVGELFSDPGMLKDCFDFLTECATTHKQAFEVYLEGEECVADAILQQACELVANHKTAIDFISTYKDDCLAIYTDFYKDNETAMQVAVLNMATDLVTCVQAAKTWFTEHSTEMDACWTEGYSGEKGWASGLLQQATDLITTHQDTFDFLCECAMEIKACWTDTYKPGEKALALDSYAQAQNLIDNMTINHDWFDAKSETEWQCYLADYQPPEKLLSAEVFNEATVLADCLSITHEWMCTQADKTYDHWCQFWVPKEEEYVCAVLDKAIELACESYECLTDWCDLADTQFDWWRDCYEDVECISIPKLISAADPACNKNIELYGNTCDRSDKLWTDWCEHYAPCDLEDLARHCAISDKVNSLVEICDNNNCLQTLGEILKDCYQDLVLPCEKEYIEEICNLQKYNPRYCDMENRAIAHVRKQYSETYDQLTKEFSKYCKGGLLDGLMDLETERVKTEAAAIQAADRWEWWREMQECDRRHRYKLDIFQVGERYATNSMQAYQLSTQGNDIILSRIHERIMRGFQWLNSSQINSQQTYQAIANAMQAGLDATRVSHFWPEWWANNRDRYLNHVDNRLANAHQLMQIGQGHNRQAFDSKAQAGQLALGAIDRGQRAIEHGHSMLQFATNDQSQSEAIVERAVQNAMQTVGLGHNQIAQALNARNSAHAVTAGIMDDALQTAQNGHFFIQQSVDDQQRALNTAQAAIDDGATAINQGLDHKRRALEAANIEGSQANAAMQTALSTIDRGHNQAAMASGAKQAAISEAMSAWRQFVDHLRSGRQQLETALQFQRQADNTLRWQQDTGMRAAEFGLANFNAANRKVEQAMASARGATDDAIQLYSQSLQRQGLLLNGIGGHVSQLVPSINAMTGFIGEGNRTFLGGSVNATSQEAALRKRCMEYLCNKITEDQARYVQAMNAMGNSIFQFSYQVASDATGNSLDSLAGILAGLNGVVGPPPAFDQFFSAPNSGINSAQGSTVINQSPGVKWPDYNITNIGVGDPNFLTGT